MVNHASCKGISMPNHDPSLPPPADLLHESGDNLLLPAQPADAGPPAEVPSEPRHPRSGRHGLRSSAIALALLITVAMLAAYIGPELWVRWRLAAGLAEAEVAYQRRHAELKAEAEAADRRLDVLDRRTHLVSLGFREVVRKVTPVVVSISNQREPGPGRADPLADELFFDEAKGKHYAQAGVGSGLLARPGYVLTNAHVVHKAQRLRITFASGRSMGVDPDAVAADALTDLAVIRLPAHAPTNLREDFDVRAEFADSDKDVERGDLVLAIGSPRGLRHTVTHGIISAKGRFVTDRQHRMDPSIELLQTDAPMNPGNSGGPLFDQYGRVVGINSAISSDTGGSQGIGWVIPSNTARDVFAQLVAKGEVVRGFIGAGLGEVGGQRVKALGLKAVGAVLIGRVLPGFPADKAGLRAGDVVVAYNNTALHEETASRDLRQRILHTEVGRRVSVEVLRDGVRRKLTLEVGRRPPTLP
jgi:S1-C subfamily serine protease